MDDLEIDGWAKGYTVLCMQVALWAERQDGSFEDIVNDIVIRGGDTDTNGAAAGAVLGARRGPDGIPAEWLEAIPERARLERLAEELALHGR